jgi:hypothetical protein
MALGLESPGPSWRSFCKEEAARVNHRGSSRDEPSVGGFSLVGGRREQGKESIHAMTPREPGQLHV